MKYRILLLILFVLGISIISTSCKSGHIDKNMIESDVYRENLIHVYIENELFPELSEDRDLNIISLYVDERQSSEKKETVFCTLEMEDDYYHYEKYIAFRYRYRNDEWQFVSYEETEAPDIYWRKNPFSAETIESNRLNNGFILDSVQVSENKELQEVMISGTYIESGLLATCIYDAQYELEFQSDHMGKTGWFIKNNSSIVMDCSWTAQGTGWSYYSFSTGTFNFIIDKIDLNNNYVLLRYNQNAWGQDFSDMMSVWFPIDYYENGCIDLDVSVINDIHLSDHNFSDLRITPKALQCLGLNTRLPNESWNDAKFVDYFTPKEINLPPSVSKSNPIKSEIIGKWISEEDNRYYIIFKESGRIESNVGEIPEGDYAIFDYTDDILYLAVYKNNKPDDPWRDFYCLVDQKSDTRMVLTELKIKEHIILFPEWESSEELETTVDGFIIKIGDDEYTVSDDPGKTMTLVKVQ